MLGSIGSIALIGSTMGGSRGWLAAGSFLLATCAFVLVQADRHRTQRLRQLDRLRRGYLRTLAGVRRQVRVDAPPAGVPWGIGPSPPAIRLTCPDPEPGADPYCVWAARRLVAAHTALAPAPLCVELDATGVLAAPGGEDGLAIARAFLRRAAEHHPPDELAIGVLTDRRTAWEWLAWLPHAWSPRGADALGPRRLVCEDPSELAELLPDSGRVLLIVDERSSPPPRSDPIDRPGATRLLIGGEAAPGAVVLDPRHADRLSTAEAEAWTRTRARPTTDARGEADLAGLLGADPDGPVPREGGGLCVPFGVDPAGEPVYLDLKEAARGGTGPHGLVVGATGSGKSELLRTLVTGLALTHRPAELNLVLVDFKGGAAFAGLAALPHVSALITNLADDLALVDRMHDALAGELTRRQELLRAAGLDAAQDHPELPSVLIVVDEFSELLAARPDFVDLFVAIGRLGRSLGIHLLLASQRLEEGRLRGLDSHLSYRIALRTFSAAESRTAIGTPDAHTLPQRPGVGLLRTGPDELVRFTAARATAPARRRDEAGILPVTNAFIPAAERVADTGFAEVAAAALIARGDEAARRIWLPPLGEPPRQAGLPSYAIGIVDRPREQRHEALLLDLDGPGGHVAIVGAPRSGKSTLARAVVCALAAEAPPDRLRCYLVDLGGGLADLDGLPHVAGIAGRDEPDLVRRVVGEAHAALDRDGPRTLLVIDDLASFRSEYDDLHTLVQAIGTRGLARDVHLLLTSPRWSEVRPSLRDLIGTRLELRLGEPMDSEIDRRLAGTVPRRPGRGLTTSGHHFLACLPDPAAVAARWPDTALPRLRPLPPAVPLADLPPHGRWLGLDESGSPVPAPRSLIVLGDPGSGRTTALGTLASQASGQVVLVDPRRSLAHVVPQGRVADHLVRPAEIRDGLAALAAYLSGRPTLSDSPAKVLVVIDDHELAALGGDPLAPLLDLIPQAEDVGLSLVVARRAAGAGRALHEPALRALRESGVPALVLSVGADEGPLLGVRPRRLPPGRGHLVDHTGASLIQVTTRESEDGVHLIRDD